MDDLSPPDRSILASPAATAISSSQGAIADAVRSVLGAVGGDTNSSNIWLLAEIEELGRMISAAKSDIAALQFGEISGRHIPAVNDELDAIATHTSAATNAILDACEVLDGLTAGLDPDAQGRALTAVTQIYEACGFQDIVGQRITKVVTTLRTIDVKVAHIIAACGSRATRTVLAQGVAHGASAALLAAAALGTVPPPSGPVEEPLMNGPQLPQNAIDQAEIDRLMGIA